VLREARSDAVDLTLVAPDGSRTLVEIKVREHQPKSRDLDLIFKRLLQTHETKQQRLEIWVFNIEQLKLHIYSHNGRHVEEAEFTALNIWEYGDDGEAFERKRVADEVEGWIRRVDDLYSQISGWVSHDHEVRVMRNRTVEMAEELMQKFAVADRELAVLDLVRDQEPIASFVPRGLWIIGAWGRVDIITRSGTRVLLNLGKDKVDWQLVSVESRRNRIPFDQIALAALLGDA
jgi:hypothetical protein